MRDEPGAPAVALAVIPADAQRRLRQALVARYGSDVGQEAFHDAVVYACEHAASLAVMDSPVGYLFRVGQTAARRHHRWSRRVVLPAVEPARLPDVEPALPAALARLTAHQRTAVVLVHGHGWTLAEVADVLEVEVSTVRNHLRRGMDRLRSSLGVEGA